jgi:histidine triad (HIT) family protein
MTIPLDCVFCGIASKRTEAAIVFEDERTLAFLDRAPLFLGHVLLIPKAHIVTLPELARDEVGPFFVNAQRLSRAIERAMSADGIFVAINNKVSQSVPHLHLHIVPRRKKDGLRGFFWPRQKYGSSDELREVQRAIVAALDA